MVEQQRQAWEQQTGQDDDTVMSSYHHSSKDTSSCDPASLSVATASSRSAGVGLVKQYVMQGWG